MKKSYKLITRFVIIVVLFWYLFYFLIMKGNLDGIRRVDLVINKNHAEVTKSIIYKHYLYYGVMPRQLSRSLILDTAYVEDVFDCLNSKVKLRLTNPTLKNILLFPIFPLGSELRTRKFKYSYIYDEAKKVTL